MKKLIFRLFIVLVIPFLAACEEELFLTDDHNSEITLNGGDGEPDPCEDNCD